MNPSAGLGQVLRAARERRGMSIEQLSSATTVPVADIEALEEGRVDALPRAMYRRAEVRACAEAVGLEPEVLLVQLAAVRTRSVADAVGPHVRDKPSDQPVPPCPARNSYQPKAPRVPQSAQVPLRAGKAVIALMIGCGALLWEQAGEPAVNLPVAPALAVPAIDPASLIDEAVRLAEPPRPAPSLRRAFYEPRLAANGQQWPRDGRLDEGVLVVHSTPRGARVTVNGVGWGVTPVAIRYLPLGTVRVRVGKADYAMHERTVTLTADEPASVLRVTLAQVARRRAAPVAAAQADMLVVTSVPTGARVTVNGIGWGTTPVSIAHLPDGIQRVRVVKEQFESEERVVTVREGQPGRVAFTLKPLS